MTATTARAPADTTVLVRAAPWLALIAGIGVLQLAFSGRVEFPAILDKTFSEPIDAFEAWAQANRSSHPLFTAFFTPISRAIEWSLATVESFLVALPWYTLPLFVLLVVLRARRWQPALVAFGAMLYPGLFGMWEVTLETMAVMANAVLLCVIIGVPLGIWAAFRPRVERALRPVLDAMQTIPAFVYFIPMVLFFGIRRVPATVATVIYALPPLVRLTTLGIRRVPSQTVEASSMFGASRRQTLLKVQFPMAIPSIMTGLNQTIMMALGIVVLAALVGAGGLGQDILGAMAQRRTGRGLAIGLAIVAVAMVLDRLGRSIVEYDRTNPIPRHIVIGATAGLVAATMAGLAAGWTEFPALFSPATFDPIDQGVVWIRDNLRWLTTGFNDFVIGQVIVPATDLLTETVAWPVTVFVTGWMCWRVAGWKMAAWAMAAVTLVGLIGVWELTLETLVQVVVGVVLSVAIAVPVGVWAGRRRRVEVALGPILDALQTIPSLVYIIPVVVFFTIGAVPGIIASVLYAIVPGIRLTALGIKEVPEETVEASQTFGATPRQTMFGVRLPLAAPTILAGVNQIIMMVLAMVIIAGLVGAGGLGFHIVEALKRRETGQGFEAGLAILVMAIILDRLTQAFAHRMQPPTGH